MDLSILIPARNEMFLKNTVDDLLKNIRGKTEIIVVLDGEWPVEPLPVAPNLTVVYLPKSIGQRAATNLAARLSQAHYLMKVDAHCAFDEGFDLKMIGVMEPDITLVPLMYNLHAFDWKCKKCGWKTFQNPTPEHCGECGSTDLVRKMIWKRNEKKPRNSAYRFDRTLHFQYFPELKKRLGIKEGPDGYITETMSLQGSCFMLTRQKYFELNICDEKAGSWGHQGTEVACKTWLSGGRVLCNQRTWYAHMFRTNKSFGFPYPITNEETDHARAYIRDLFLNKRWPNMIHDIPWLVEKFKPVPDWHDTKIEVKQ